jgi:hypothetical protein
LWPTYLSGTPNVAEIRLGGTEMIANPEHGCLGREKIARSKMAGCPKRAALRCELDQESSRGFSASGQEERQFMNESIFMHGWATIIGALTMIAIIVTATGPLLGVLKLAYALRRIGALLGTVTLLTQILRTFANLWSAMSVWQGIALAAIGTGLWQWRRSRAQPRKWNEVHS